MCRIHPVTRVRCLASPSDASSRPSPQSRLARRRPPLAFTLVELLVVIGIIALLAGILLVALKGANRKAREAETRATMNALAAAAQTYRQEHQGEYPGVIPEALLASALAVGNPNARLTGTENFIIALLGGYRLVTPDDGPVVASNQNPAVQDYLAFSGTIVFDHQGWRLKVNRSKIGEGPVIKGKQYQPYVTLKDRELRELAHPPFPTGGAAGLGAGGNPLLPEAADAWGQPILYFRRISPNGPLAGPVPVAGSATPRPQFALGSMLPYLTSTALGDLGKSQIPAPGVGGPARGSILNLATYAGGSPVANVDPKDAAFAQIIRHAGFGNPTITSFSDMSQLTTSGEFVLISAGPDGIYFSVTDGPGSLATPVTNIVNHPQHGTPQVVNDYDDIRVFGGG